LEAIEQAIKLKQLYKVQKLNYLISYLNPQDETFYSRRSPLHLASESGYIDLVAWLLAEGASAKLACKGNLTPLHLTRNAEVAKLLLAEGACLEAKADDGRTPLLYAVSVYGGCAEMVKLLLSEGADPKIQNNQGLDSEALHENVSSNSPFPDCHSGDYNQIKYLLLARKPNFEDEYGSELHLAIRYRQLDLIKNRLHFKDYEGLDLEDEDKNGQTVLCLAVSQGLVKVVKWLLAAKAEINMTANFRTTYFQFTQGTPLHEAVSKILQLLLEHGADTNALDGNQLTPKQIGEKDGKTEIVKIFQLHESPQKIIDLEKITQQQQQIIQQMQKEIGSLTQQLQQSNNQQQKNNSRNEKKYSPNFIK
jgi:ankyrin repeat protein